MTNQTPHKCPCCDGFGKRMHNHTNTIMLEAKPCISCSGTGIVWSTEVQQASFTVPEGHTLSVNKVESYKKLNKDDQQS